MELLARLAEEPSRAGLFLDVDGVLAPIVARPEDARVPEATRTELRRLHARYALVACISGRDGEAARRIVGVPELTYVGNHGLELEDAAAEWRPVLQRFLRSVEWPRVEDKGLTAALHYRDAPDEQAARAELEDIAGRAREVGFVARFGRKVLDVVPPVPTNKGRALRLLLERSDLRRALVAGDDTTDLDAFYALDGLDVAVRVAVASAEGPRELREQADVVVDSPAAFAELLRSL